MNQFAWLRQDLSVKSQDFAFDGDALGMRNPAVGLKPRKRRKVAAAFLGYAFADLVPVPASMVKVAGALTTGNLSGAALAQGQAVYLDSVLLQWFPSQANVAGKDQATGICMTACAAAGQPVSVLADAQAGQINLGCAVAAGAVYIASSNAGGIVLYVDGTTPTTGWKTCIIGIGISTTVIQCVFRPGGVAHA